MKKRLLSLMLAVVMLLSLLPVTALAATEDDNGEAGSSEVLFAEDVPGGDDDAVREEIPQGEEAISSAELNEERPKASLLAAADDTPNGNLCRPKDGVTAAASANSVEGDHAIAPHAIDGDYGSRWCGQQDRNTQTLTVDLGTVRSVGLVKIFWRFLNITAYTVQLSEDENTWDTVYTCNSRITELTETIEFTPVNARYIKLEITGHDDNGKSGYPNVELYEFEAYRDRAAVPVNPADFITELLAKDGDILVLDTAQNKVKFNPDLDISVPASLDVTFGANLEQVVGADGTVYTPLVNTKVEFDIIATNGDGVSASSPGDDPITIIIPGEHIANMGNAKPKVIPEIMEWYSSSAQKGKNYTLTASSKIVAPTELNDVANEVKADIKELFGFDLTVATSGAAAGDIILVLDASKAGEGFDEETYLMEVTDRVTITGTDAIGVYWGTRSALQALKLSRGANTIPQGTARDYPEFKVRGFVLDVGRKPMSMKKLEEITKNMAWYKMNDFHVHINDNLISMEDYKEVVSGNRGDRDAVYESWDDTEVYQKADRAYSAFRLESDIREEAGARPLTAKDYHYTKAEYKAFVENSAKLGVDIVTEIDVPAHAKAITDAFPSLQLVGYRGDDPTANCHPYNDHLDLSTPEKHNASMAKTQEIFNEYLDEGIFGNFVHFGADEYYASGTPYRRFVKDMINYLKDKKATNPALADLTIRQWGSLTTMSSSEAGLTNDDLRPITSGVQMNIWNYSWANPKSMYDLGYDLINTLDDKLYIVPDAGYYFNYLNSTDIYNNWTPNNFANKYWAPASSSQMAGAAYAIWNDKIDTQANGIDEIEVYDRFASALPYISVKMWGEGDKLDRSLDALLSDAEILGDAPGTNPYHEIAPNATSGKHFAYDFTTDGSDTSGNDRTLTLNNATVTEGALTLAGGTSYAETGMDVLGYNSTLSFKIMVTQAPAEGGEVIFETDHLSGAATSLAYNEYAIKALPVAGNSTKWKLGFSRELYDYEFATEFNLNEWYTLKLENARSALGAAANSASATKLYVGENSTTAVNAVGAFVNKGEKSNTDFAGKTGITKSYLQIPVARIGSKTNSFVGKLDDVSATSPADVEPDIPDEGTELVNLALNKPIVAQSSGASTVSKVTDGNVTHGDSINNAWQPDVMIGSTPQPAQWFVVDLGEDIGGMGLSAEKIAMNYWRQGWPQKYKIQTTADDPNSASAVWTDLVSIERSGQNGWIGSVQTSNLPVHQEGSRTVGGYALANSDVIENSQMSNGGTLQRYVRVYVDEVQEQIGQNPKTVAVIELLIFARVPETESAENIKAYQITENEVYLTWDDPGATYYQVYAKAPGGTWECISGEEVVDGNTFTHTGYVEGTTYRVLTPASEVTHAVTATAPLDIRGYDTSEGHVGYVDCGNTERVSLGTGWATWPDSSAYGGGVHYAPSNSATANTTAEFAFVGTGIQVIGTQFTDGGAFSVFIDGVDTGEKANSRTPGSANVANATIYSKGGLTNGFHTIKLVADVGTRVEVDAFRVLVPVTSIALSATGLADGALTISTGGATTNVTATVSPANGWGELVWTSSSEAAATVSATEDPKVAAITPVAGGSTTIVVKDKANEAVKAEVAVTVNQAVANVTLPDDQHSMTLYLNPGANQQSSATLTPTVMPTTATNKNVTYSSSAESVATVDENGAITAVAAGEATITVTTEDGAKTTTCAVTVKCNPTAIAVKDGAAAVTEAAPLVLYTNQTGELSAGKRNSAVLTAELTPAGAETGMTWNRADGQADGLISVVRDSDDPTQCTISVTGISETNVGEKIVEVKSTSNEAITTTFKVRVLRYLVHDVTISVGLDQTPRPGVSLEADVNALHLDDAGKNGLSYQWYRGDTPINGATGKTYILTDDDIGAVISVKVTAEPTDTYFYEGERTSTNTVNVGKNAAPAAPSLTATDVDGSTKGTITIADAVADAVYEISSDNGATWREATVENGVIGDLDAGHYMVRLQATDTHDAGQAATITVRDLTKTYYTASYTATSQDAGVVTLDKTSVEENTSVSITVKPNTGYEIAGVTAGGAELEGVENADGAMVYTVENVTADVAFVVTFEEVQVTITHQLSNGLKCSKAAAGMDSHEVAYGTQEVITLVADEGYDLPAGADIQIKRGDGTAFTAFTYSHDTGVITITGGATENLTIIAAGVRKTYQVAYTNMTGVTGPDGEDAQIATHGQDYTATLTPQATYKLPETITVKRGEDTLNVNTDYTYDPATGVVTIKAAAVTGNLSISAAGERQLIALVSVSIEGTAKVGERLTATVNPAEAANYVSYQWVRVDEDGNEETAEDIEGTNGMSRVITEASLGKRIKVKVVPAADSQYTGSVVSQTTAAVIAADAPIVPVELVSLDKTSANVKVGETVQLTVTVSPSTATNQTVRWSSDNEAVATVDSAGVVKAVAAGSATITVTSVDGEKTAACTVTVTQASPSRPSTSGGTSTSSTTTTVENREDGTTVTTVTKPDGSVTETVAQPDGTKAETVTQKDGDKAITVTDAEGEEIVKVELPATIPAPETEFEDISVTPWAEEAINNVAGLKLVEGVGGNKYAPTTPMTRGALATVLHRFSNGSTDYKTTFVDIAEGKYYTQGVAWAAKAGVVKGVSDELFAPDDTITREQLAVMMARYAKLIGLDVTIKKDSLSAFSDGDTTGVWAVDGMAWCVENGILKGKGNDILDPTAQVTRAEVAVMLDRFIAIIK